MTEALGRLVAEAQVLAGGEHPCAVLGHKWESVGGRPCPRVREEFQPNCSQAAYECASPGCGAVDYGEPGGPGYRDCYTEGPCSPECNDAIHDQHEADTEAANEEAGQ